MDRAKNDEDALRYTNTISYQCIHLSLNKMFRNALFSWKRNAEIKHNGASRARHAQSNQNET
jgi:hypothetical protein